MSGSTVARASATGKELATQIVGLQFKASAKESKAFKRRCLVVGIGLICAYSVFHYGYRRHVIAQHALATQNNVDERYIQVLEQQLFSESGSY